ncbi:META domain-containing protein [Marinobacter fonticola]|uniref:META domain-containing protein n=1 Tax=Marinobacter fonticola TaxID=2603215 RepID=UPI0011E8220B|nr:META domain-containing protein [Marinobacter fonticola]
MKASLSLPVVLFSVAGLMAGCASKGPVDGGGDRTLPLSPGTYTSEDERQVWAFWENGMFERSIVRDETAEADPQFDWGQWHDINGMGVAIARGGDASRYFLDVQSAEAVTLKRSESADASVLYREDDAEPLETERPMTVCFMTQADAPLAYEPRTRRNWPVQMEAAYPQLEAAYSGSGLQPPARLPMQVTAHWIMDDAPEGSGDVLYLRAVALDAIMEPGEENCPQVGLQKTYWVLKTLGNESIEPVQGKRDVHIVFDAERKLSGLAGCNRFSGPYARSKDSLALGPLASTRMMCPDRAGTENALFVALDRTQRFAIEGETLLLMTEDGKVLAQFQAGMLK